MKFKDASAVRTAVEYMRQVDLRSHSDNRAKINQLFNGEPPYSQAEAEENGIETNGSFLEATSIASKARSTWNNAFLKPGNFFTVTLDSGPLHKRSSWGHIITSKLNKRLKRSLRYTEVTRATGAQVVLHGIGPIWWKSSKCWIPEEVGIEDILVPSGTRVSLDNLEHFAIHRKYTAGELFRMTHGKKVDPGWNMAVVDAELKRIGKEIVETPDSYQDSMNPEKLVEFYKANDGFLDTDSVPTISVWDFYYREHNDPDGKWYRKMLLESPESADFLYNPTRCYAGDLSQILHITFGDGANVAPFRYHSVRSLGFLLYFTCHLQNRLRCRFMDAIFEATLQYFKVENDDDRARLQKINLQHLGIIPSGLTMVPPGERWQINTDLVVAGLSQNRQLMSENASAFVQDVNDGTSKELTATEVMARLNSANQLVSSLLSMSYTYKEYEFREIARRFCLRGSTDKDVRKFQKECMKEGVPREFLNSERWEVQPERVMGGGNKTLELAQAKSMLEIRPLLDPEAQRDVTREYVLAVTDDPDKAMRWVPPQAIKTPPAAFEAQVAVGALMNGVPVGVKEGIDHISYVEAVLQAMQSIIEDIEALGGMATQQQITGLVAVYQHVTAHIQIIAQNEAEKERVKQYMDLLGNLMNYVKAYAQRLDEQQQAQQQDPEAMAKAQSVLMQAQMKSQITQVNAAQKQAISQQKFQAEEARKDAKLAADLNRQAIQTDAEIQALDATTAADIQATKATAKANAENKPKSNE